MISYSVCIIRQLDPKTQTFNIIGSSLKIKKDEFENIKIGDGAVGKAFQSDNFFILKKINSTHFSQKNQVTKQGLILSAIEKKTRP